MPEQPPGCTEIRSRRSSRPSCSSSVFTLDAAGSLRMTPVAPGACVSCTVMLWSSHTRGCPARPVGGAHSSGRPSLALNTAVAELLPTVRRRSGGRGARNPLLGRTWAPRPEPEGAGEHVDSTSVKLRLPGRRPADSPPDAATVATASGATAVGAAGKGRPTPKRAEAQGRRSGPVPPPPTTRKEAFKRQREQQA